MAKHIDEEATQYVNPKASNSKPQQSPEKIVVDTKVPETKASEKPKKATTWKNKAASAGSGILIGGIAGVMMGAKAPDNLEGNESTEATPNHSEVLSNPGLVDDQVMVATGVNDEMSFGQAFAEARAEVGPGGVFEWRGSLYGTYTADEWNSMSAAEKAEYNNHFAWNNIDATDSDVHNLVAETPTAAHEEVPVESVVEEPIQPEVVEVADVTPASVNDPVEIEVLGVVEDTDTGAIVAGVLIDDNPAILVDVDGDHVFDTLVADFDGDGQITDNEYIDVQSEHLTVDQAIASMPDNPHNMASYEPDTDTVDQPFGFDDQDAMGGTDDASFSDPMIFDA